jgi:hypothetical protein
MATREIEYSAQGHYQRWDEYITKVSFRLWTAEVERPSGDSDGVGVGIEAFLGN